MTRRRILPPVAALLPAALAFSAFTAGARPAAAAHPQAVPPPTPTAPAKPADVERAATPEELSEGQALLASAVKAHGGDAFLKMKSLRVAGTGELTTPEEQGSLKVPLDAITLTTASPDRTRLDADTAFGKVSFGVPGKGRPGWYSIGGSVSDLPASAATVTDPLAVLRVVAEAREKNPGWVVRSVSAAEAGSAAGGADGKSLKAFEVSAPGAGLGAALPAGVQKVRVYVEADSGLMRRITINAGSSREIVTLIGDYKAPTSGGVRFPTTLQLRQKEREVLSLTFSTIQVDAPVEEKDFERPTPPGSAPAATGAAAAAVPGGNPPGGA